MKLPRRSVSGIGAHGQFQLDVYGEVMDALHQAQQEAGSNQRCRLGTPACAHHASLKPCGREPDEGIWEVRGERRATSPSLER